jgi:hypothetical protein
MTWLCHVCGGERPDRLIAVARAWSNVGGVLLQTSARYCTDRPRCATGAVVLAADWLRTGLGRGPHPAVNRDI